MSSTQSALDSALARLARAASLLVVSDFDGTLAQLNPDPAAVVAHPESLAALNRLSAMPQTEVVVLSGRHLAGLRAVCPLRTPVVLVGSHGAEPSDGALVLDDESLAYLAHIEAQLDAIAATEELASVEVKPYQRVLHVAAVAEHDPARADELLSQALALKTGGRPVTPGSNIVEFSAVARSKGDWVALRAQEFAATMFIGDDVTDESVFPVLGPNDVGVKVLRQPAPGGDAPRNGAAAQAIPASTSAEFSVDSVDAVADVFNSLAEERQRFVQD
ncbi:trehalose-phosphatase [Corynebacterium cystitidis]|uniref:Trehalose 6-phosphate phosphatase n=1 Tax=Corynebacterium cystitidis DSM 20524 TaxID=1121357 RepID=A0A1H9W8H1_9CORY|nr:trehalose-phosphatase [Corynebacterium cystitidis]WJY83269.1 Trehalose-6-phosphate phosphatase [Corynebacterium cystitidis DSM 20524]SES30256.1 trehalose 6-phosphate phosphatase [Corynebacterium cystitidis DSM 20524]SNV64077.1 Trehalose-phosphate phosphatase [Corynebacterium cystitidis]